MFTHLTLYTTHPQRLQHFYTEVLGLPTQANNQGFDLSIGQTILHWRQADQTTPYHYAVNIPTNKVQDAQAWLQKRVDLQPYKGEAIINFEAWNAEAMYFYDTDQNIVELIARHNTQPKLTEPFGVEQWLGVSEIGAPTPNMAQACAFLMDQAGIARYSGNLTQFAAIGNEEGLFILIDSNQRNWMPNEDKAHPSPFQVTLEWEGSIKQIGYTNAQFSFVDQP